MPPFPPRHILYQTFSAAIAAAQPGNVCPRIYVRLTRSQGLRRLVIGAGKAAAAMAQVVRQPAAISATGWW